MIRKKMPLMAAALMAMGALVLGLGLSVNAQGKGPPAQAKKIQGQINAYKAQLAKAGKYMCCTKMPCDMCATHMGMCPCRKMLAAKKGVCPQCKGMWHQGMGAVPGVKANDVKVMKPMMKKK